MKFVRRCFLPCLLGLTLAAHAQQTLSGKIVDQQGRPIPAATIELTTDQAPKRLNKTVRNGAFTLNLPSLGRYRLILTAPNFQPLTRTITLPADSILDFQLTPALTREDSVVVTADINDLDVLSPDPAERVFVKQDLIDANPGRPGAPVSIPGYPIETASSGIKAPQYFAPGVAGDHGEPIAQYIAVGSYLVPNNLSANAHGNGYADPNLFIPSVLESVQVDGGAFNVRQGNHAVNVAATYALRSRLDPFLTLTADHKDVDLVAGVSPSADSFAALELSFGNGFLRRLEHRQQYKLNAQRILHPGSHTLTVLGIAYWGKSYIPGLTPIFARDAGDVDVPNYGDTIDPRQRDQTHTALFAANDIWRISAQQQLHLSGFFRTYNLALASNFGQGLIRQSEFRTVTGLSTNYINKLAESFSLLAGFDYHREAPRRDNLDQYANDYVPGTLLYGPFNKVSSNNVTIASYTPYAAASGSLFSHIRYYAGWRRDEIEVTNRDLISPANSFQNLVGLNSPKATVSFLPGDFRLLPLISASFGQVFFTVDPRIGTGTAAGTPVGTAHSYQLVVSKTIVRTDLKLILGHVTTSQQLAKIDADTGLQEDQGPGRLKFLTIAARHTFARGSILVTFSKADARDLDSGGPTPEAPRTIFDILGNLQKLPFGLQARGEFEYVGAKTLGTGCLPDINAQCLGVAVKEFRAAAVKPLFDQRLNVGVNSFIATGFTGQTLENFGPSPTADPAGVRIPSYASLNLTYKFGHQ